MAAAPAVFAKLFTQRLLTEQADGRTFIRLLGEHVPSWLPHRYGWSSPLRHVYDPTSFGHFWTQLEYHLDWRNEKRTATGEAYTRVSPYSTLAYIELKGELKRDLDPSQLAALAQDCAEPLELTYGIIHLHDPAEETRHGGGLFGTIQDRPVLIASEEILHEGLPDLAWGTIFGPPYVALFGGAERLRTAPAALVRELGPDRFYLQLTGELTDVRTNRSALLAARQAAKAHLGADCFRGYPGQVRAPRLPGAAEAGLWSPPPGFEPPEELRQILERAAQSSQSS